MAIKGLKQTQAMLKGKAKLYRNGVREVVRTTGSNVVFVAKLNAPQMIDKLISGEIVSNQNGYGYIILVKGLPSENRLMRNIPVYLEFGTGIYAADYVPTLPKEWQDVAESFIENKKGKTKEHSYLVPAWISQTNSFVLNVRKALQR